MRWVPAYNRCSTSGAGFEAAPSTLITAGSSLEIETTDDVEAAQAVNIDLHRRLIRAKDKATVYARDPRRHAAVRVKDSIRLADALAGSFVVDCGLAAGDPPPSVGRRTPVAPFPFISSPVTRSQAPSSLLFSAHPPLPRKGTATSWVLSRVAAGAGAWPCSAGLRCVCVCVCVCVCACVCVVLAYKAAVRLVAGGQHPVTAGGDTLGQAGGKGQ